MPSVGTLILLVVGGAVICVEARAAGPAAMFPVMASAMTPALTNEAMARVAGVRR